jgi:lysophospholipase L1-like esterase
MRLWYARMLSYAPMTPSPRTAPTATVGEGNPDQVLLLGNGPLHGWGVMSHGVSVVGHLAQQLWRQTARPTQVDFVGDERMTAASATAWLGDRLDVEYDVIVIALGMNDALRLEPVKRWAASVDRLLDHVRANTPPSTPIVLVELPHIRAYAMASGPLGAIAQLHARRLGAVLHRIAATSSRITAIPAPIERFEPDRVLGSSEAHQHWAQQLSDRLVPILDAVRAARPPRPAPATTRHEWSGTERALSTAVAATGDAALTAVTERAQQRFGVALAAVNLIEGDRAWFVANTGGAPMAMPSELAYCSTTVAQDAPLVVPNSRSDGRFRDNPFLDVVQLPFYAGIPLHGTDGRAIGTFCLLDSTPHDSAFASLDELRVYADEAELLLRAMETSEPTSMITEGGATRPS